MLRKLLVALAADRIARMIHPVIVAYVARYHDDDETGSDSGTLRYDPRSSVAGQAEIAANRDHDTPEVWAFGFTSQGRGNGTGN